MAAHTLRLNWFLWGLYHFFRLIAWVGTCVFFRRRLVLGREHLRQFDGPGIVVVNHPSTLMDVLVSCSRMGRVVFFLANYSLFKHPVSNWLLSRLYCIPVKRREDMAEGEARNNDDAFAQSIEHLVRGGVLFIAPEGVSYVDRFIRPFKTGTARIALGALAREGGPSEVRILPIGLSYRAGAAQDFRSEMVMHIGAPVAASEWLSAWQQNATETANQLTQHLENQLKTLTVHTRNEVGDVFVGHLEMLLRNSHPAASQQAEYERAQHLARTHLPDADLQQDVAAYTAFLKEKNCSDAGLVALGQSGARTTFDWVLLLLGAPLAALGWLLWAVPSWPAGALARRLRLYPGYDSTVKILSATFVFFPLALWGVWLLVRGVLGSGWWFLPVVAALVVLGFFTEKYRDVFRRQAARRAALRLAPEESQHLLTLRADLVRRIFFEKNEDVT
jgi:glycerol-3-phosphate O-acyltransferase / dihydroxyacetone phosphate acyltransferase